MTGSHATGGVTLDNAMLDRFCHIEWFHACGLPQSDRLPDAVFISTRQVALAGVASTEWADIRTEAQGDLTAYLASRYPELYGGRWNTLASAARKTVDVDVRPVVEAGLHAVGLPKELANEVVLDLERIVLRASYGRLVRALPVFYAQVLEVYEAGHLPCGWVGARAAWPNGQIMAF